MIDTYETINFQIFKNSYPELAEFCIFAEKYIHQDPITSLMKIRQFGELLAKELAASISLYTNPRESQYILLNKLEEKGIIKSNVVNLFHQIRIAGNKANHEVSGSNQIENYKNYKIALKQLNNCHKLSIWYLKLNGKYKENIPIPAFSEPPKPNKIPKKEETILELETLDSNYKNVIQEINDIQNKPKDTNQVNQTIIIAQNEAEQIKLESGESESEFSNINLLSIGSIINNHYKITDILGAGNFGQTYLAEDTDSFNKKVVVKQFRPQFSDEGTINSAKNLFEREARSLDKLNKIEGIPDLKAYFEENNQFFLVQEFIDGYTLEEEILVGNKLTESEIINLLKDILKPLQNVHSLSIIHRDIKPSNLIRNINDQQIYLIDFGAVKEVVNNTTKGTIVIGTKGYMPFEQLQGQPQFSSDIYAVGIIAIQAATGLRISNLNEGEWQLKANHLSAKLIQILEKMTAIQYQQRYTLTQEILDDLNSEPKETEIIEDPINEPKTTEISPITEDTTQQGLDTNTNPSEKTTSSIESQSEDIEKGIQSDKSESNQPKPKPKPLPLGLLIAGGVIGVVFLGLFIKSIPYFTKAKVSIDTLTIGTLGEPERYTELRQHLESELIPSNYFKYLKGNKITISINGDKTLSYQEAMHRISDKRWDVAFTLSPIISIHSKKEGYQHIADMFPGKPFYEAGLIVHKDSPIQSLDDLKPSTTIALGDFNSSSSFYMPVYDLYGKTISVNMGHKGGEIRKMVINKEVDIGSAAVGDIINKKYPDLRLIGVSRKLPGSGVYISPNLSEQDQNSIKKVMLSASPQIKSYEQTNYGEGKEVDYTEFEKIIERVELITICTDFSKNPVKLYCPEGFIPYEMTGTVNGISTQGDNYLLKVTGQDSNIYLVTLDKKVFNKLVNGELNALQGKQINIQVPNDPQKTAQGLAIKITQIQQIKIIN